MKTFNVASASFAQKVRTTEYVLAHAAQKSRGKLKAAIMFGGDPGVGKTSYVRDFAKLVGVKLVIIEVPHIVEEHIVNIPFVIFNPATNQSETSNIKLPLDNVDVKLAKSNLYVQLHGGHIMSDQEYLTKLYQAPQNIVKMYEEMEGTKTEIPEEIRDFREKFRCILFLDEYFRETSMAIRNILRGILDGKIGQHDLPPWVYPIFASNLKDEGVEGTAMNADFRQHNFGTPGKDDWFHWLVTKFENDKHVKLDPKIVDKFYDILEDADLSETDVDSEVRVSPRRWEQLLLYINNAFPLKSEDDARGLLTHVKLNFRNYLTGDHAKIADKVVNAVAELINELSGFNVSSGSTHGNDDWQKTLLHQIEQKMKKGGHHLKYISVVSGLPGVGKTEFLTKTALALNLVGVYINTQQKDPSDVIGIPLPGQTEKGEIDVKFSEPPLYKEIQEEIKKNTKAFEEMLKAHYSKEEAKERFDKWKKAEFKYLIFFDELNRTKTKVFNGLRRVLLEKSFGDGLDLPKGSIIVGAINPDDRGTNKLTSHLKDVIDVVPVGISWNKWKTHLESRDFNDDLREPGSAETVKRVFYKFVDKFKTKNKEHPDADPHFFLDVGSSVLYISPREYTDLISHTIEWFDRHLHKKLKKIDLSKQEDKKKLEELELDLRELLYQSFESTLGTVLHKHGTEAPQFMEQLRDWFLHSDDINIGDLFKKHANVASLEESIGKVYQNPHLHLYDDVDFVNYLNAIDPHKFGEDLLSFLIDKVMADIRRDRSVYLKNDYPKKELDADDVAQIAEGTVSRLEHFIREIVHALRVHRMDHSMYQMVQVALRKLMVEILEFSEEHGGDDEHDPTLMINQEINQLMKNLKSKPYK
jgi:MoxR-like ATPase